MIKPRPLLELVTEAKYIHPWPNYRGILVWFGGGKLYAYDYLGVPIGECRIKYPDEAGVKETCELVIEKLVERGVIPGPEWPPEKADIEAQRGKGNAGD